MNFAALTAPLTSSAGPCGEDLSLAAEFDAIREARRFDDPTLPLGEWVRTIKEADWDGVARLCEAFLATRAKDLRVAGWLTEARARTAGLAGLADGYELLTALCEAWWDDIHPQPDDGDLEERAGAFEWLLKQTPRLLREVPLTDSAQGRYSLADQEAARETARKLELNPHEAEEIARSAALSLEDFETARRDTPSAWFADRARDAARLQAALTAFKSLLDARLGALAPSFGASFDALERIADSHQRLAGVAPQPGALEVPSAPPPVEVAEAVSAAAGGPIRSREQAIRQLEDIAAYFRRTEPHSPVAYLAEKAARWGSMSLHEWLRSVVKDDSALLRVEELLGVEGRPDDAG